MHPRLRSTLTLLALTLTLMIATVWGWRALTNPLPTLPTLEVCVDTPVAAGTEVFPDQVVISVFNASNRNGLASKTLGDLVTRGFVPADTGNAPEDNTVKGVQIWATDPENPAVDLVRKQFRKARVVIGPALGKGVVVVVGDQFKSLKPKKSAPESISAAQASTICSPPGFAS